MKQLGRMAVALAAALLLTAASGEQVDNRTEVTVPTGVTTVLVGSQVTQQIRCAMTPGTTFTVSLTTADASEKQLAAESNALVSPHVLVFDPRSGFNATDGLTTRSFTLFGLNESRYYLSYAITQGGDKYRLSASSSVVVVAEASELGWQGIWYELALNATLFLLAVAFFAWRRLHQVELPIWRRGARARGLFERANFDDEAPETFNRKYSELAGATAWERARKFWHTPCSGLFAGTTCGIPAALSMQFHADAGHLFALLSVFSLGVMLPVNLLSGNAHTSQAGDTFQQTTLSNVPLGSDWYWIHVGYCYMVAAGVILLLVRQDALASHLRRIVRERLVGARSVFIQHGLPPSTTNTKLRDELLELLAPLAPTVDKASIVRQVAVVHDLRKVHAILARRHDLAVELERARELDAAYEAGTLSWSLVCCPGSSVAPSLHEMASSFARCRPCRYACRRDAECRCYCCKCCCPRHHPVDLSKEDELYVDEDHQRCCCSPFTGCFGGDAEPQADEESAQVQLLIDELDFFPDQVLKVYDDRECAGRAFVTFDSTQTRNAFFRLVRSRSCGGRVANTVEDFAMRLRGIPKPPLNAAVDAKAAELADFVPGISVTSAPEPADVIWENVAVRPTSAAQVAVSIVRHLTTLALLLLFSTPTAVLVYIRLDAASDVYSKLEHRHSLIMTLAAAYLPSLLLIAVNWCLLTFLYFLSMSEPAISESKRTKSFLVKGFVYLVVSTVFLPSIGVTVAYLAVSGLEKQEGRGYVGAFLYKVSGTFFISYVCQRAFLGAILDVTRAGERLALHPWLLSRAVTEDERQRATRPSPYPFGHDYALVLSVLLVVLLCTVITPIMTPFGALYFYLKVATNKYNFFYVLPYSAGRGHIAQTAHALTLVCLLLFEFTMAFVLLQVAGRRQFIAVIVLFVATGVFYVLQLSSVGRTVKQSLLFMSDARFKTKQDADEAPAAAMVEAAPPPSFTAKLRNIFRRRSQSSGTVARYGTSYADPYKVTLSMWSRFGVNQVHRMASSRTQMRYALLRLRQNAEEKRPQQTCCSRCLSGRSVQEGAKVKGVKAVAVTKQRKGLFRKLRKSRGASETTHLV